MITLHCCSYENVPLPRRLGTIGLVSSKGSFETPGKHSKEINLSGDRSAMASQSVDAIITGHIGNPSCNNTSIHALGYESPNSIDLVGKNV